MTTVALFRNMNLGHPGSPTSAELLAAFGGPRSASIFQTNGTVLLTEPSARTCRGESIDYVPPATPNPSSSAQARRSTGP